MTIKRDDLVTIEFTEDVRNEADGSLKRVKGERLTVDYLQAKVFCEDRKQAKVFTADEPEAEDEGTAAEPKAEGDEGKSDDGKAEGDEKPKAKPSTAPKPGATAQTAPSGGS